MSLNSSKKVSYLQNCTNNLRLDFVMAVFTRLSDLLACYHVIEQVGTKVPQISIIEFKLVIERLRV